MTIEPTYLKDLLLSLNDTLSRLRSFIICLAMLPKHRYFSIGFMYTENNVSSRHNRRVAGGVIRAPPYRRA